MPADDVTIVGSAGTKTVVYSSLSTTPRHLAQNPFKSFGVHLIVFEQKSLTKAVTFAHVAHDCCGASTHQNHRESRRSNPASIAAEMSLSV